MIQDGVTAGLLPKQSPGNSLGRSRRNSPLHVLRCSGRRRLRGKCLTPHDYMTNVQKRLGNRAWTGFGECRLCGSFLDTQLEHGELCSTAEVTRRHDASVHSVVCGLKLADPGITTEPRGLTASQSRSADIFTTAAVRGRCAALDVCVASSNAAAAQKDAAQVSFDCKPSHYRNEIPDLRNQGIHYRALVWTADGRPHPCRCIASSCKGQQMSGNSLQCRWKHEIQMALLRRRAAMTRVLPNLSARPESSPVSLIGLCITGVMFPPLDGGPGDDDHADSESDTATPDDDDDIASLASQSFASLQPSAL